MNIAKDTAKRMLQNIDQQLQALAQEQQSMNGNRGGSAQYKCGGRIKRHHMGPGGGIPTYLDPNTQPYDGGVYDPESLTDGNAYMLGSDWWNKITNKQQPYALPGADVSARGYQQLPYPQEYNQYQQSTPLKKVALDTTPYNPGTRADAYTAPSGGDLNLPYNVGSLNTQKDYNINFSNSADNPALGGGKPQRPGKSGTAMDWMGLLPTAFNLGAGLFSGKAQKLNANKFQNPYEQQALSQMPSQYRIDPLLNEYKNAYANTVRNVNNQGNSRGERMANYGAAQNQYGQQVGGAYAEKFNQENQMATRRAMMMNEQGQQRAGVNLNVQNMNDQNQAAALNNRMGYLGAAATGAQRYSLVNKQMKGQQQSQDAWLWAIQNQPHFKDWVLGGIDPNNLAGLYNRK